MTRYCPLGVLFIAACSASQAEHIIDDTGTPQGRVAGIEAKLERVGSDLDAVLLRLHRCAEEAELADAIPFAGPLHLSPHDG